jgi:hypothetical protein
VYVQSEGGISIPASQLGKLADAGPAVGAQLGYWLSPRVALRLGGQIDLLDGARVSESVVGPDLRLWHYSAGVEANLLPSARRWSLFAGAGLGATTFDSDEFVVDPGVEDEFRETYFTADAGLRLGYLFSPRFTAFVGTRAFLSATDEEDTGRLALVDPTVLEPFGTAWTFPVTAGLTVRI